MLTLPSLQLFIESKPADSFLKHLFRHAYGRPSSVAFQRAFLLVRPAMLLRHEVLVAQAEQRTLSWDSRLLRLLCRDLMQAACTLAADGEAGEQQSMQAWQLVARMAIGLGSLQTAGRRRQLSEAQRREFVMEACTMALILGASLMQPQAEQLAVLRSLLCHGAAELRWEVRRICSCYLLANSVSWVLGSTLWAALALCAQDPQPTLQP